MTSMTATPELRQLLAAVIAAPDDNIARQVYADALQEYGHATNNAAAEARAEFIRLQIELVDAPLLRSYVGSPDIYTFDFHRGECEIVLTDNETMPEVGERIDATLDGDLRRNEKRGFKMYWPNLLVTDTCRWEGRWKVSCRMNPGPDCSYRYQRKRVQDLFNAHGGTWSGGFPYRIPLKWYARGFVHELHLPLAQFVGTESACPNAEDAMMEWDTGALVCCSKCDNTGRMWDPGGAVDVFASNPVAVVRPTDKKPTSRDHRIPDEDGPPNGHEFAWMEHTEGMGDVRFAIESNAWVQLEGREWGRYFKIYDTEQQAFDDLSRVLVEECRSQAEFTNRKNV